MAAQPIGIQLFTVREQLKEDYRGTLEELAQMGYSAVELGMGFGGMPPAELAAFLEGIGLKACGLHAGLDNLLDAKSEVYDYAEAVGTPYMTTGLLHEVEKDWHAAMDGVMRAAEVVKGRGFTFTYHNHAEELLDVDGVPALDLLYDQSDPDSVHFELDTYWLHRGGKDPVAYIRKYAGRLPQLHLKDMDPDDGSFTEIGEGLMDLAAIFSAAEEAGVDWVIYEQDRWKRPPLESCRMSIANLKKLGYA